VLVGLSSLDLDLAVADLDPKPIVGAPELAACLEATGRRPDRSAT
jgi:hypothetical protein